MMGWPISPGLPELQGSRGRRSLETAQTREVGAPFPSPFSICFFFCWKTCETQALEGHLIHSWFEAMTKHRFILLSKWAELRPLVKRWLRWQKRDRRRG